MYAETGGELSWVDLLSRWHEVGRRTIIEHRLVELRDLPLARGGEFGAPEKGTEVKPGLVVRTGYGPLISVVISVVLLYELRSLIQQYLWEVVEVVRESYILKCPSNCLYVCGLIELGVR